MANVWWERLSQLRVTPTAAVWFSIFSIAVVPFADTATTDTLTDVLLELALGVVATLALWLVVWPGLLIVYRWVGPGWGRQAAMATVLVMGGGIRGAVIFFWGGWFAFDSDATLAQRLLNSITTTVVWMILFSLFSHASSSFKRRYDQLFRQIALSRASETSGSEVGKILGGLEASLKGVDIAPANELVAQEEMARIAQQLENDVVEQIRQRSAHLWAFGQHATPRLRFLPLLNLAVSRLNYSVGFVVAVFVVLGIPNVGSIVGLGEATWRVVFAALVIIVCHVTFWRVIQPRIRPGFVSHVFFLISVGLLVQIPMGLPWYLFDNSSAQALLHVLLIIPVAALPVLDSVLRLAERARVDVLDTLQGQTMSPTNHATGPHPSVSSTSLASYLHNSLQSEIQSIILALRSASTDSSRVHIGQASLERLRLITKRSLDEEFSSFVTLPREHLNQVVSGWKGILDISVEWQVDDLHNADPRVATVVQIVEEVASNSAVRGKASTLSATVTLQEGDFVVAVRSDAPEESVGASGQGSQWLDAYRAKDVVDSPLDEPFSHTYRVH